MLAGLGHSKSVLYKGDYLVPRKVLYLGPIGTECLRTHVERLACIQFDSSMVHCARLCTIAIPNVARSILIHAARPERVPECRTKRSRTVGTRRRFCQRSPCTFFPLLSYAPRRRKWNYYAPRRAGLPLSYCSRWMHFAGSWAHFSLWE